MPFDQKTWIPNINEVKLPVKQNWYLDALCILQNDISQEIILIWYTPYIPVKKFLETTKYIEIWWYIDIWWYAHFISCHPISSHFPPVSHHFPIIFHHFPTPSRGSPPPWVSSPSWPPAPWPPAARRLCAYRRPWARHRGLGLWYGETLDVQNSAKAR